MTLKDKLLLPSVPTIFFEMVPPALGREEDLESAVAEARKVAALVDAINLPEIHDEERGGERTYKFVARVEPRALGARIFHEAGTEFIVNRCVVYEPDQLRWFRESQERFGVRHVVLVGGESSQVKYPGPSVLEVAAQVRPSGLDLALGGISIPSRLHEAERIRKKKAAGLTFFTTQVLFDSNDIVGLLQRLNGLEARVFLSFAPVTRPRDLEFLRWLGADIPKDLDRFLFHGTGLETAKADPGQIAETAFLRSLDLAQRILMDVFDNLPPEPPLLGLNVEHINQRNLSTAVRMLEKLGNLYNNLVAAKARASLA